MAINKIKIELLNDIDSNEMAINLEYNIVIVGKEGKFFSKDYLIIF